METYFIYENGNKTTSRVLASNSEIALSKANKLNKTHKLYNGTLTVKKVTF